MTENARRGFLAAGATFAGAIAVAPGLHLIAPALARRPFYFQGNSCAFVVKHNEKSNAP